jgi:hypothetical protein
MGWRDTSIVKDQRVLRGHVDLQPTVKALVTKIPKDGLVNNKQKVKMQGSIDRLKTIIMESPDNSLRVSCAGACLSFLFLIASLGPIINPGAYGIRDDSVGNGLANILHAAYPVPQTGLALLLAATLGLTVYMLSMTTEIPPVIMRTMSGRKSYWTA